MPWPVKSRTTPYPNRFAYASITRPITLIGRPGATALMPRIIASRVRSTSSRASSLTLPTQNVASVSPCTPSRYAVTSTLMMSPSSITVDSGMPWQTTSLSAVQRGVGVLGVRKHAEGERQVRILDDLDELVLRAPAGGLEPARILDALVVEGVHGDPVAEDRLGAGARDELDRVPAELRAADRPVAV